MLSDYFLASGRWDNTVIVIDLKKAIDPANDATENAVINRLRVTPDIETSGDGKAGEVTSGQPICVTIDQAKRRAYITNHSGKTSAAQCGSHENNYASTLPDSLLPGLSASAQHGWPGSVTVINLDKALDCANWGTLGAVETIFDSMGYGPTGFAITPDGKYGVLNHAESKGCEDGGRYVNIFKLSDNSLVKKVELAYGRIPPPGFILPRASPDERFGCFPCPNGLAISPLGGGTIFTSNGGTRDVSVISLTKALAGGNLSASDAEIGRIPTQSGGFGIGVSPDGKYVAATSREDPRDNSEGNTISIIKVETALKDPSYAEINRILVGSNNPDQPARPFLSVFTPDGKNIVVTNFRTNNISIIDAALASSGAKLQPRHIPLETPDGGPSRPRGIAFSSDGIYMAISGAVPKLGPGTGVVWVLDTRDWTVKGRVTGIGNETYFIGGFTGPAHCGKRQNTLT